METFGQFFTQLNERKWDFSQAKKINSFQFGKYQLIRPGRVGYVFPFDLSLLSKKTRENIKKLQEEYLFDFDQIIVSPVFEGTTREERIESLIADFVKSFKASHRRNPTKQDVNWIRDIVRDKVYQRHTILITGHDYSGKPIVYARIESDHHQAGQTKIYWSDGRSVMSATSFLKIPIPYKVKLRKARETGNKDKIIDVESELF